MDPRPVEEEFGAIYPENYLTHEESASSSRGRVYPRWVTRLILAGWFGYEACEPRVACRLVGRLLGVVPWLREIAAAEVAGLPARGRGRLLDVGCGNGAFLQTMAGLGWDVSGVEPDQTAAQVARQALGDAIHCGTIDEAPFAPESFDAIVMKHVIEHLHDPSSVLARCHRLLKRGGRLVLATPNAASLGGVVFGRDWLGWDVPRHLLVFSPTAMRSVLEMAGFQQVRVATNSRKAPRMWQMSRVLRDARRRGAVVGLRSSPMTMRAIGFWLAECVVAKLRPRGEELWATAEKS